MIFNQGILTASGLILGVSEDIWNDMAEGDKIRVKENVVSENNVNDEKERALGWVLGSVVGDGSIKFGKSVVLLRYHYHAKGNTRQEALNMAKYARDCIDLLGLRRYKNTENIYPDKSRKMFEVQVSGSLLTALSPYLEIDKKIVTDTIENASLSFQSGFMSGLFDADGHVFYEGEGEARGICVSQSNHPLLRRCLRMLANFGILGRINMITDVRKRTFPHGGTYECKASYALKITKVQNLSRFQKFIGFVEPQKLEKLKFILHPSNIAKHRQNIIWIDEILEKRVFDVSVSDVMDFHRFAERLDHEEVKPHNYDTRPKRKNNIGKTQDDIYYLGKHSCKRSRGGL